ncbi:MAG TPA: expansin EXLX1 family cellulose-binding protein [Polyangiaceae bacterium]|jgi:expansin (peptidoglycan-binding protein)
MREALGICAALLALACSGKSSDSGSNGGTGDPGPSPTNVITMQNFGAQHSGVATFYTTADGTGACLYDKTSDPNIAALNISDWDASAWCGACVDITGPSGNVERVRIVDECPDCMAGQLDLHPDAFAKLAPTSEGRIPITWTFVACDVTGPVAYKYKDGSNPYWTAVQVENSRYPISKLESSTDGTTFTGATREDYNYFLNDKGFGTGMVQVRITAESGEMLTDTLPAVQPNLVTSGKAQFQ